jgi:NAD(P)-dependent dehydrogenase (short-subunit alcohol dehydrogenase family)
VNAGPAEKRIAMVTGGGTGIGQAVALRLATEGYEVVIVGRRLEVLQETVARSEGPGSVFALPGDVRDPSAVKEVFRESRDRFGRLDLLFNNAGTVAPPRSIEEVSFEDWRSVLDTNLTGAFLCTQEAVRVMKSQRPRGGRIINNGSIAAYVPRLNSVSYTAAKHGITGLTRSTALDGRGHGIACGQIDIGNAATQMTDLIGKGGPERGDPPPEPRIDLRHVTDAVVYMAGLPLDANVLFMTVMATEMPYVGRG